MASRGDNGRVGAGSSEDGSRNRSFSRGGCYGGGGDGWGRRGGGGAARRGHRGSGSRRGGGFRGGNQSRRGYKRKQESRETNGKRPKIEVGNRLKEVDIGVTEFVGNHEGFSGVVKERYGDFHVHEIALNGEIAKLTDQRIPPEPEHLEDIEGLKKEIPFEIWEQLQTLNEADNIISSIDIDVTSMNKEQRRAIHSIAKKIPNVVSQTVAKGETKLIVVAKANKQRLSGHKFRRDQRVDWSRRGGNYCHFVLHKVNTDTMDALNQLGMHLRIKSNMFNYAGTKDRRARTSQWVSLRKINPIDILAAGKSVRGAYVGNFKFCEEPLKLGMLSGNRFRITLRSVTGSDEEIEKAMISLRDNGFINYYGLQRFGTVAAIPTHEIGRALLQGKWHEAIELILKPRAGEQQMDLTEAREIYKKTKDAHAAHQRIARPDKIEAKLLWGLHVCGEQNPQGALDWIPRNTNLMYIHAYQSLIWNIIVSKRIRELGPKPVVGDLVYENPNFKEETERLEYIQNDDEEANDNCKKIDQVQRKNDDQEKKENLEATEVERPTEVIKQEEESKAGEKVENKTEVGEENSEPTADIDTEDNKNSTKDGKNEDEAKDNKEKNSVDTDKEDLRSLPAVKILTEEDLPNYTLADIVMPQPGWRVTYPPYAKPWFDKILAKDGLTTDLRQKNRKYTLGGAYRKMLEIPSDISWRVTRYKERYDDLILCDVDEMRGLPAPKEDPEGKHKALIVEMSLKPSTYATMALREILKCDTSPQTQAAQSAANKAQEDEEKEKISSQEDKQKSSEGEENKNNKDAVVDNETKMNAIVDAESKAEESDVPKDEKNNVSKEAAESLIMDTNCSEITKNTDTDVVVTK